MERPPSVESEKIQVWHAWLMLEALVGVFCLSRKRHAFVCVSHTGGRKSQ
jgi:hypothetical protein